MFGSIVYLCNGSSAIVNTGWCYHSRFNACKFRNCEITFISILYDCLYPKATYCALSSTVHPDLCISYDISDVDLIYYYINIVMHVCHYMILFHSDRLKLHENMSVLPQSHLLMSYTYLMYL